MRCSGPLAGVRGGDGDRAEFSGLAVAAPLIAPHPAMSRDEAGYPPHKAHLGGPSA